MPPPRSCRGSGRYWRTGRGSIGRRTLSQSRRAPRIGVSDLLLPRLVVLCVREARALTGSSVQHQGSELRLRKRRYLLDGVDRNVVRKAP